MSRLYAHAFLQRRTRPTDMTVLNQSNYATPLHVKRRLRIPLSTWCLAARNISVGAIVWWQDIVLPQHLRQPLKDMSIRVGCWRGRHWQALSRLEGQARHLMVQGESVSSCVRAEPGNKNGINHRARSWCMCEFRWLSCSEYWAATGH